MKKNIAYPILLTLLALFALPLSARGQQQGTLRWHYTDVVMESQKATEGEQMVLSLDLTPDETLASTQWIEIKISLRAHEGRERIDFDPIYVAGANRHLQLRRSSALRSDLPDGVELSKVLRLSDLRRQPLHWGRTLPMEEWMSHSDLVVEERVLGCASCEERRDSGIIGSIEKPVFGPKDFEYKYLMPVQVAQKRHEAELVSHVNFVVARHEILPNYKDNPRELKRISDFVKEAFELTALGVEISTIQVRGYASPEGRFDYNHALSERRSQSLADHIRTTHPELARETRFRAVGEGEDWAGLRTALTESDRPYAAEVVAIIDKYTTDTERERDIKALDGGKVYKELLDELYPPLRRSVIKIEYRVPPFTVDRLPAVYQREPALMSHYELCQLADLAKSKGEEPLEIYRKAYERFGTSDPIARLNYATALLEYQPRKAAEALTVVSGLKEDPQTLMISAMAYQLLGNQPKAEELYEASKR